MTAIGSLLEEVRYEMLKVVVLNAFLDSAVFFLAALLLLSVFGMGLLVPVILSLAFLGVDIARRWRRFSYRAVEERNPEIREMLRTAADNKEDDSLMAHALFTDVMERMRKVSSGSFLSLKGILAKVGVLFVLSVVVVGLAFFNVSIQKFENPLAGVGDRIGSLFGGGGHANETAPDLQQAGDIYGEPSIAKLGSEQVGITLQQSLNQVDFTNVQQADPASADGLKDYPAGVSAQASQAYTGGLEDINDRKTAAEYSQQIRG